jgi:DNA adenine methylase
MTSGFGVFPRVGGKYFSTKYIIPLFPPHDQITTFIDAFVGGGSVYIAYAFDKGNVINDLDRSIISTYRDIKRLSLTSLSDIVRKLLYISKEEFYAIRDSEPKTIKDRLFRNLVLGYWSYFADRQSYSKHRGKPKSFSSIMSNIEKAKTLLARTTILNSDYKDVVQKYDSPTAFFYFDPPYLSDFKAYENSDIDYEELKNVLDNIKGYWALSINDLPYFHKLFKGYHFTKIPTRYIISGTQKHSGFDLLIRNYQFQSG